jgi:transcriptional antiterminator RfaH
MDARSWAPIRSSKGVAGLVAFGGGPARVEASLIAQLQEQEARLQTEEATFRPGERVVILDGPFRDLQALYEQDDGKRRAYVLIEFLSRSMRVPVERDQLRKAS